MAVEKNILQCSLGYIGTLNYSNVKSAVYRLKTPGAFT